MKYKKSFYNVTVLGKDITRFCPVWIIFLILNILPTLVLRYNTPKLKSMLLRLKRSGSKQN